MNIKKTIPLTALVLSTALPGCRGDSSLEDQMIQLRKDYTVVCEDGFHPGYGFRDEEAKRRNVFSWGHSNGLERITNIRDDLLWRRGISTRKRWSCKEEPAGNYVANFPSPPEFSFSGIYGSIFENQSNSRK